MNVAGAADATRACRAADMQTRTALPGEKHAEHDCDHTCVSLEIGLLAWSFTRDSSFVGAAGIAPSNAGTLLRLADTGKICVRNKESRIADGNCTLERVYRITARLIA